MSHKNNLVQLVTELREKPFEWGVLDCTLFPLYCLDEQTGGSAATPLLNQWESLESAVAYSEKNSITLESYLRENGCVDITKNFQQTGDFLMLDTKTVEGHSWLSAAVCLGRYSAVCTEKGVEMTRTADLNIVKVLGIR